MTIIVAFTLDRAIGRSGDMIYHISADLRRFKEITLGHPVIMGRRTFESLPKGALPGRANMVISRNPDFSAPGVQTFLSLSEALEACAKQGLAEPMVIGGGQIYSQALPLADTLQLTVIDAHAPDADAFFPAINPAEWSLAEESDWMTDAKSGVNFKYQTLKRPSHP